MEKIQTISPLESELIEKYKTLEVFTNLHKLEEDSSNVATIENQEQK